MIDIINLRKRIISLAIQGKLSSHLSGEEKATHLLKRTKNERLLLVKQGKLNKLCVQLEIFKHENSFYEKYKNDIKCIDDEIEFEIPEEWAWTRILTVCENQVSNAPTGETFRYIDIDSIDNKNHVVKILRVILSSKAPSRARRKLEEGSTIFSLVRPYLENIAYISRDLSDCIGSTGFYVLKPIKSIVNPRYLFMLMTSDYIIQGLNNFMRGDNSPSIRSNQLNSFLIPLPPFEEQKRIVSKVDSIFEILSVIETEQQNIIDLSSKLKKKTLCLAMEGSLMSTTTDDYYNEELSLGDILVYEQPTKYIVKSTDYSDNYDIPVLTAGKSFILGKTSEKTDIKDAEYNPVIIFDDFTTAIQFVDFNFKVKSSAMKILNPNTDLIDPYFGYLLLNSINIDSETHKRYWISEYMPIKVKLLKKECQIKIVDMIKNIYTILDTIVE